MVTLSQHNDAVEVVSLPSVSSLSGNSSFDGSLISEGGGYPCDDTLGIHFTTQSELLNASPLLRKSNRPLPHVLPSFRPNALNNFHNTPKTSVCATVPSLASYPSSETKQNIHDVPLFHSYSDVYDLVTCSCCQKAQDATIPLSSLNTMEEQEPRSYHVSLIEDTNTMDDDDDDDDDSVYSYPKSVATHPLSGKSGVSNEGVAYQIKRVVVEGLLYKKGTGSDWLGSRGWKARWTHLALGRVEGYGDFTEVPLLCIARFSSSTSLSTVIVLDSTVAMVSDVPWHKKHPYRFEIRQASTQQNTSLPVTRIFSAPSRNARGAWVYAMSDALLTYEKEKAKLRLRYPRRTTFQGINRPTNSVYLDDVCPWDENNNNINHHGYNRKHNARTTIKDGYIENRMMIPSPPVMSSQGHRLANPPRRPTSQHPRPKSIEQSS